MSRPCEAIRAMVDVVVRNGSRDRPDAYARDATNDAAGSSLRRCGRGDLRSFSSERIRFAMARGVVQRQIVLDPGIGFGKLLVHNLTLLAQLHRLRAVLAALCWSVSHERRSLGSWWTVRFRSVSGPRRRRWRWRWIVGRESFASMT